MVPHHSPSPPSAMGRTLPPHRCRQPTQETMRLRIPAPVRKPRHGPQLRAVSLVPTRQFSYDRAVHRLLPNTAALAVGSSPGPSQKSQAGYPHSDIQQCYSLGRNINLLSRATRFAYKRRSRKSQPNPLPLLPPLRFSLSSGGSMLSFFLGRGLRWGFLE